jgi:hypothetical protein
MSERVFATIPKGRGEEVRVAFSEFKGRTFVAIRIWYAAESGEMKPSSKGINLAIDHLPALADAISKALELARTDGLVSQ